MKVEKKYLFKGNFDNIFNNQYEEDSINDVMAFIERTYAEDLRYCFTDRSSHHLYIESNYYIIRLQPKLIISNIFGNIYEVELTVTNKRNRKHYDYCKMKNLEKIKLISRLIKRK